MQSIFRTAIWWDDTTSSNSLIGGPITNNWVISSDGIYFCYFSNSQQYFQTISSKSCFRTITRIICIFRICRILQMIQPRGLRSPSSRLYIENCSQLCNWQSNLGLVVQQCLFIYTSTNNGFVEIKSVLIPYLVTLI